MASYFAYPPALAGSELARLRCQLGVAALLPADGRVPYVGRSLRSFLLLLPGRMLLQRDADGVHHPGVHPSGGVASGEDRQRQRPSCERRRAV